MGNPAQTAPLVLSQGGVKNCQEDTALREPSECPPPNHKWESSGSALCIHQDNARQPTSPPGKASSRWEPHPPARSPGRPAPPTAVVQSPGSSQVSMVMVAGAPFTATRMSLVSLAGNRPALHPPQYPQGAPTPEITTNGLSL